MKRAALLALATVIGFTLAGSVVGGVLGLIAPGFVRVVFKEAGNAPFDPKEIGLGSGVVLGFLSGAVVIAVRMIIGALSGLSHQRLLGRRAFQPTLAGLLSAIALVALALASLKNPSRVGGAVVVRSHGAFLRLSHPPRDQPAGREAWLLRRLRRPWLELPHPESLPGVAGAAPHERPAGGDGEASLRRLEDGRPGPVA